jgi:hypothetical protein
MGRQPVFVRLLIIIYFRRNIYDKSFVFADTHPAMVNTGRNPDQKRPVNS